MDNSIFNYLCVDEARLSCAVQFCVAKMQSRGSDLGLGFVYFAHKPSRWDSEALNLVDAELILQRIFIRGSRGFSKEKRELEEENIY